MKVTEPETSRQYAALYQATIEQAVSGAASLMTRLVAHSRAQLRQLEAKATERRELDRLTDSRRLLNQFEASLCERFTEALLAAFARMASVQSAQPPAARDLHFDELAGMDASRLRESVETARVQQSVQAAADSALTELNQLICTVLEQPVARLEHNPLRPVVYVDALTSALAQLRVAPMVRQGWLIMMSGALGKELDAYYHALCGQLRAQVAATGGSTPAPAGQPATAAGQRRGASADRSTGNAAQRPGAGQNRLTLETLRRLLADRPGDDDHAIGQRYATPASASGRNSTFAVSETAPTAFRATVPAAFEALQDMKQIDRVVQRLEERKDASAQPADGPQLLREKLRRSAHGLEQTLGLEVVAMMIDNIAHDQRLLGPIQRVVAELEPALLQLAMIDPRFFSHKQHPARRLLHEITQRSIAFESTDSRGFSGFMEPLREAVAPLSAAVIETAEPFNRALSRLVDLWDEPAGKDQRQIAKAVKALLRAEQRNTLAATIVAEVSALPDAALVPDAVLDFLCGPWAQVVANARITDRSGAMDPGHYARAIDSLIWSAQPQQTSKDVAALTQLAPELLRQLREGLATIDYPQQKTDEFFALLNGLHRQALNPGAVAATSLPSGEAQAAGVAAARMDAGDEPWVAPTEARASGFIDLQSDAVPKPAASQMDSLVTGVWVALLAEGSWTRTRLTWASPNATLFLFTDALGYMQSLTRRACEQLFATGGLRLISAHPVEDALDAVAQTALRNSVDVRF